VKFSFSFHFSSDNKQTTEAEENNVQAEDILTLKRLQEKVLKEVFRSKRQKTIDTFCKNAVKP
jgi:hypothetical protein